MLGAAQGETSDLGPAARFDAFLLGYFVILLAKQLSKTSGCREARTARVPARGPGMQRAQGQGKRKREQQGGKKEGGGKKDQKKKDINSLENARPQRGTDSARHHSTCHRRQTDRQPRADQIRKISPLRDPH